MKIISIMLSVAILCSVTASARDKNAPPKVVQFRDEPLQRMTYHVAKIPRQCSGPALIDETCWEVWLVAQQTFDRKTKSIAVLLNVSLPASSSNDFSYAAVAFAIDGEVSQTEQLNWDGSATGIYGAKTSIQDESLARKLALAKEVWVSVLLPSRISVKLNPKQIEAMKAIVDTYDSLQP
jgi:hypothetical protein